VVEWLITLSGQRADIDRLLNQNIERLSVDPNDPLSLRLALSITPDDSTEDRESVKTTIEGQVKLLNGLGRLRWGRTYEGVRWTATRSFDENGRSTQQVFLGVAIDHMLPEEYADMVERLGNPRPELPKGLEIVDALNFSRSLAVAEAKPEAVRAIRLVELMMRGDDQIDWAAGYAALEIVEHDMVSRGTSGQELEWWTRRELRDFKATANSPEALGISARHGRPTGLTEPRMTTKQAHWFVRRVVARWLAALHGDSRQDANTN
jgi:hypothetical protein